MREIKYRGLSKRSGVWVYGSSNYKNEGGTRYSLGMFWEWVRNGGVDPETVGEYTGLHDKNGVEIYEGDILNITDEEDDTVVYDEKVVWDEELLCWSLYDGETPMESLGDVRGGNIEVIGNIHENPELTGGK